MMLYQYQFYYNFSVYPLYNIICFVHLVKCSGKKKVKLYALPLSLIGSFWTKVVLMDLSLYSREHCLYIFVPQLASLGVQIEVTNLN